MAFPNHTHPDTLFLLMTEIDDAIVDKTGKESKLHKFNNDELISGIVRFFLEEKIVQLHETFEVQTPEIKQLVTRCYGLISEIMIGKIVWKKTEPLSESP